MATKYQYLNRVVSSRYVKEEDFLSFTKTLSQLQTLGITIKPVIRFMKSNSLVKKTIDIVFDTGVQPSILKTTYQGPDIFHYSLYSKYYQEYKQMKLPISLTKDKVGDLYKQFKSIVLEDVGPEVETRCL